MPGALLPLQWRGGPSAVLSAPYGDNMNSQWPESMSLGEIIRRQREMTALPMRQLAAMAGISNPYLSQIERGLREPSEQVLKSLADCLQLSADSLRARSDEPDDPESAVLTAIAADPDLTAQQRKALQESYRAFREITIDHRREKGRQRRTR